MITRIKDKWLFVICLAWAMLWVFIVLGEKGWLPYFDFLVGVAAIVCAVPVSLYAIVIFLRSLMQKQVPVAACASLMVIAFAIFCGFWLPRKPTQICQIPGTNEVIRFFFLDSIGGATTSDAYRVTFQDGTALEKTIFHAYSSPAIEKVECQNDAVVLLGYGQTPMILPVQWIKESLIYKPLDFYKNRLESLEYQDQVRSWDAYIPTPTPIK
jgi:hypothetical protein